MSIGTMAADSCTIPRLPQELEYIIFDMAARNDRGETLDSLLPVARRLWHWLRPLLYKIVIIDGTYLYHDDSVVSEYVPRYPSGPQTLEVKHLLVFNELRIFSKPRQQHMNLFTECHNIQDFAIWRGYPLPDVILPALSTIIHSPLRTVPPLQRLSISLKRLFSPEPVDFTHEIMQNITHLDVLDYLSEVGAWQENNNYSCLTDLRGLAFRCTPYHHPFPQETLAMCLSECKRLDVLILLPLDDVDDLPKTRRILTRTRDGLEYMEEIVEDRVVVDDPVYSSTEWAEDWYLGAMGGDDIWARGEAIIKQRRRGRSGVPVS